MQNLKVMTFKAVLVALAVMSLPSQAFSEDKAPAQQKDPEVQPVVKTAF